MVKIFSRPDPVVMGPQGHIHRLGWGGILAGVLTGIFTYVALLLLGLAIGFINLESASLQGVATGAVIWLGVSLAIASYLAGLVAARGYGGLTPARGRFNGLIVGMILLLLISLFTVTIVSRVVSGLAGLAGSVVSTTASAVGGAAGAATDASGGLGGVLDTLGIGNEYQALVSGFNEEELTQLIAQGSPELNEQQVSAAVGVITDEVQAAGQNIGDNLSDISNIGQIVTRQADNVQTALSGEEFTQNLVGQGLSEAQAQEVATVINERVTQTRQQIQEAATAVQQRTEELAETAARTAARAAWVWLLLAGITLLFTTLGGGSGKDVDPDNIEPNTAIKTGTAAS